MCGNGVSFLRELASFTRVITHDQRGIGLSSRHVAPADLETRAADLRLVLDAAGADRVVLCGIYNSGGVNALLAATDPERVHSLVWIDPGARTTPAPDYPGVPRLSTATRRMRTRPLGHLRLRLGPHRARGAFGNALPTELAELSSRQSRNACTPDVAKQMAANWYEIDVRAVLPAVRCPALLLPRTGYSEEETAYIASLMPSAEIRPLPPGVWSNEHLTIQVEEIRRFMGIEPPPPVLDSVLAAVLFTDIVGSTAKQAALGDAGWKALLEQHHAAVRHEIERWHGTEVDTAGDGFYATFEGPARAVRCALAIGARVRDLGLEIRAGVHVGECTLIDGKVGGLPVTIGARIAAARRRLGGVGVSDGQGPRSGLGTRLRGRGRIRPEGRPGPLAPLPGRGRLTPLRDRERERRGSRDDRHLAGMVHVVLDQVPDHPAPGERPCS